MKVAIYCRLSEEDRDKKTKEDDSESIQNQKSMLISYTIEKGWEIYKIYSDDDYTGSDRNRPEFNSLLEDAKARKFDIVLCKTQSRFTRELELVEKYIHDLFPRLGIRFISIVDNADTEVKGNKKARQINGLINEWYLEDISESIKSVFVNKRKNGHHIGAFALYGYLKNPEQKGHLIIDEEAAEVVREVFQLFADGYGKTAIARMLNDRGIPNPTEYKRQKGLRYKQPPKKQSTLWKYFAVSNMLVNEIYIGHMVQGKYGSISYKTKQNKPRPREKWYRVENTHEPIIDFELWERVQVKVKERAKPFDNGKIGIFAGKVKCMNCEYNLRTAKHHQERYLKCPTRFYSKEACAGSMISVRKLEQVVLAELQSLNNEHLDRDLLEQEIEFNTRIQEKLDKLNSDILTFEKKSQTFSKAIQDLYLDKTKEIITEEDFIALSKNIHEERKRVATLIGELKEEISELELKKEKSTSKRQIVDQYTDVEKLTREIIEELIDYIEIGSRYEKSRDRPINIFWNF